MSSVEEDHRRWKELNEYFVLVKDELAQDITGNINKLYKEIYGKVSPGNQQCRECTTANILPCFKSNGVCKYDKDNNCLYHDKTDPCKIHRPCPNGICHKVYKEVKKQHRHGKPNMKNSYVGKWCDNPWELAKSFMPDGYTYADTAKDTDLSGVLSVFINCKYAQTIVSGDLNKPDNIFSKLREVRNTVVHAPNSTITKEQYVKYREVISTLVNNLMKQQHLTPLTKHWKLGMFLQNIYSKLQISNVYTRKAGRNQTFKVVENILKNKVYDLFKNDIIRKQAMGREMKSVKLPNFITDLQIGNTAFCEKKAYSWRSPIHVNSDSEMSAEQKEVAPYDVVFHIKLQNGMFSNKNKNILELIETQLLGEHPECMKDVVGALTGLTSSCLILLDSAGLEESVPCVRKAIDTDDSFATKEILQSLGFVTG